MSLKAKLEAVIYAAEEPVTLAQFATLFATEALDWKAAAEAATAEKIGEAAVTEPFPPLNGEFSYAESDAAVDDEPEPANDSTEARHGQESERVAEPVPDPELNLATGPEANAGPDAEQDADAIPDEAEAAEARRQARVRDREARAVIRQLLDELIASYVSDGRGVEIREIAGGYRMATKPECHDAVRMFVKSLKPALKLSLPALEALAVIAYKQPVTAPEVNEIRGVDSSGVFGSLLARKLIATAGRKPVIGRPILYKTTREFLLQFGLKDLSELPSMEEFEKMAQLEFEDMETAGEGEATPDVDEDLGPEVDEDFDEPIEESAAEDAQEKSEGRKEKGLEQEDQGTAATADSNPVRANQAPDTPEPLAGTPATQAETSSAEAAPAAPSPLEQAE